MIYKKEGDVYGECKSRVILGYLRLVVVEERSCHACLPFWLRHACCVVAFSQDGMAKNIPTIAKSAAMAGRESWVSEKANPARVYTPCNNFGVVACYCLLWDWVGSFKNLEEGTDGRE